jgi:hypothetical protein
MRIKGVVLLKYEDGSYIKNPSFVDYHDGAGVQIDGGIYYDKDNNPLGHADPPGPRGVMGEPGVIDEKRDG